MNQGKRAEIFQRLRAANPTPTTELVYASTFQLLVAVILSAQATDKSVNLATRRLFADAPTPQTLLALGEAGLGPDCNRPFSITSAMPSSSLNRALSPYTPSSRKKPTRRHGCVLKMFTLVDDVEDYPKFLPWCSQTHVAFRDASKTVATLHISYLSVKSQFTTENAKEIPFSMNIRLVDGPFRRLEGFWRFKPLADNACKIEFRLSYEFSTWLFEKIIGPVFSRIADTFAEAFVRRADDVYGVPNV